MISLLMAAAPLGGQPLPVIEVAGPAPSFTWWFPPSMTNPLPVIDMGGAGAGAPINGPYPPTANAPWPLHVVPGGVVPNLSTWWPPTTDNPWPVVLVTGVTPPNISTWWPPSSVAPWPVYFV
jgi:hypothetical protein